MIRISADDLNSLMSTLEVNVVSLSECLVARGYRLEMGGAGIPAIHYNLQGTGRMFIGNGPPIELKPHTLVVVPPNSPFRIETAPPPGMTSTLRPIDGRMQTTTQGMIRRFVAGDQEPEIILICGFFHAVYGSSTNLFGTLGGPIVEEFEETGRLDSTLRVALGELVDQEIASGAMSSALLKQVIVMLLQRSLTSLNQWVERFAMLSDPQIARAFAEMAVHPGANHSVVSLAQNASLSRSTFMARFTAMTGHSPMVILRDLRMRQAAKQLSTSQMSVDQIAHSCGYDSRSSFVRAFQKAFACDPSKYRANAKAEVIEGPVCVVS
jgi:AraC family transcriptional activator of mtrCDE